MILLIFFLAFVFMFLFSHKRQVIAFGGSAKMYVLLLVDFVVALAIALLAAKFIG